MCCRLKMFKGGLAAILVMAAAEVLFVPLMWPVEVLFNWLKGTDAAALNNGAMLFVGALVPVVSIAILFGCYVLVNAVLRMVWKPLPLWTFWVVSIGWMWRVFSTTLYGVDLFRIWYVMREQGPYASEYLAQVGPFYVVSLLTLIAGFCAFEVFFNKMNLVKTGRA